VRHFIWWAGKVAATPTLLCPPKKFAVSSCPVRHFCGRRCAVPPANPLRDAAQFAVSSCPVRHPTPLRRLRVAGHQCFNRRGVSPEAPAGAQGGSCRARPTFRSRPGSRKPL